VVVAVVVGGRDSRSSSCVVGGDGGSISSIG
jgi:hypothetical protein